MAAAQLNHASVATTVSTASPAVTIAPTTAGSTLILMFAIGDGDKAISSITSAGTPTWTKVDNDPTNGSVTYWGTNIATGTVLVTVNLASADVHNVIEVNEWSGLASFEGSATVKTTTTGTTWTSNSYTTTHTSDVVIGWVSGFPTGFSGTTTVTPTGAWTLNATTQISGDNFLRSGYQVLTSTGSFTYSGTTSQSAETLMHVLAFVQTGGTSVDISGAAAVARAVSSTATVETAANVDLVGHAAVARAVSSLATVLAGGTSVDLVGHAAVARAVSSLATVEITANVDLVGHAAVARAVSSLAAVSVTSVAPPVNAGAQIAQRIFAEIYDDFQNWSDPDRNGPWTNPEFN